MKNGSNCKFGLLEKGYKYPCSLECPADGSCVNDLLGKVCGAMPVRVWKAD